MVIDLLPQHKSMLTASAIKENVAGERGYRTITVKAELKRLGFADYQCLTPTLIVPIFGVTGEIALYHHRPDQPRIDQRGKIVKYEFPRGAKMALDVHPSIRQLVRDPYVPLFITEGVKKADAAISIGLCCIAVIGTWNWRGTNEFGGKTALPDWDSIALKDQNDKPRQVYICYDSDVMTKPQVHQALSRLSEFLKSRGARVAYIYLPHGTDGSKVGLDDYLAAGHDVDDLMSLVSPELRKPPVDSKVNQRDSDQETETQTVAQKIVALAADVEFFHSERGEAYGRMLIGGHLETHGIRSSAFKQWISGEYYRVYGKPAGSQATEDAMRVFEAKARFDGDERIMSLRCARSESESAIYVDMADRKWQAIRVTADGWQVVTEPPALFRRHATQSAFCLPDSCASAADIELLRKFLNIRSDGGWLQLIAWLVAAWIPEIAHPVLMVYGEQGTAKSTLMRLLSLLIDPSHTPLRTEPKDEPAWMQSADHTWMITLDNVSVMPNWLSDSICRAVTGSASVKRQLYTDADDVVMAFRRVVAVTSIDVVARRGDLLDRSILLGLEPIRADRRRSEKRVFAEFEEVRPRLIGALLSILSGVMRELPRVEEEMANGGQLPRMADFANVGVAVERALGWPAGSFMSAYLDGIGDQNEEALASAIIYEPLLKAVDSGWSGTAAELLAAIVERADEKVLRQPDWPKNAKALSSQLRRIAPNLRAGGFEVAFSKRGRSRNISIIRQVLQSSGVRDTGEDAEATGIDPFAEYDARDANDADIPLLSVPADYGDDYDPILEALRR